jgi:membrane protease YdiL (CAAX protease family)
MTIIYRILSLIINTVAVMLTVSLLGSIPMLMSSPQTMLSAFMMIAVILYSWFSFKFRRDVLQKQQTVSHSLRDWVRVNGIVTMIFSIISILGITPLLANPQPFVEAIKNFGVTMPLKSVITFCYIMLVYAIVLLVHILWTFALLKKHKEYFQ